MRKLDQKFVEHNYLQDDLDLNNLDPGLLMDMLRKMILIRLAEEKIADNVSIGKIKCPCHLAIGQEAVAVAVAMNLKKGDKTFGAHRSHSHYLAQNEDTYSLFAEVLGKFDGCSKGMGGSMHIIDKENGFFGSVPIVGATIPIATGAGLANKMNSKGEIAVSYFGDGACEEGVLHESLNLSSVLSIPVIYVCENNLFSSHMYIDLRQSSNSTARFADAHNVNNSTIDGNDVVKMYSLLNEEINEIRKDNKPYFLEAVTYRWRGHVGHREDLDVGVKRSEDLHLWKKKDPIKRLSSAMIKNGLINEEDLKTLNNRIKSKIDSDWIRAESADYPENNFLTHPVYSK